MQRRDTYNKRREVVRHVDKRKVAERDAKAEISYKARMSKVNATNELQDWLDAQQKEQDEIRLGMISKKKIKDEINQKYFKAGGNKAVEPPKSTGKMTKTASTAAYSK